ncbi:hypothetical protein RclHR1_15950005 [Rhizophagus clarus]|uniref:Uncharacterized protein n=1 Tax=Rhizophagus clarus TaxID=94130 RepID=A0A2Z6QX13_9GLOM|nr:hypothetical protein RclHR1_15950005 [Rhizophagus clarus]
MKDTLESRPFIVYEWDKKLNGIPGLIAIAGSMILLFLFFNPPAIVSNGQNLTFAILAPRIVTKQIEEPPLTLADFLSNVGGYLGIWGIFGFLFGGSKELEKMKGDASARLDIPEEEEKDVGSVTEMSQPELKNLLAKYYVDMDFYEYAKDT